jgi:hypothetical protein
MNTLLHFQLSSVSIRTVFISVPVVSMHSTVARDIANNQLLTLDPTVFHNLTAVMKL